MPRVRSVTNFHVHIAATGLLFWAGADGPTATAAAEADLILHNGKIITVDRAFSIHQALAVKGDQLDPGRLQ